MPWVSGWLAPEAGGAVVLGDGSGPVVDRDVDAAGSVRVFATGTAAADGVKSTSGADVETVVAGTDVATGSPVASAEAPADAGTTTGVVDDVVVALAPCATAGGGDEPRSAADTSTSATVRSNFVVTPKYSSGADAAIAENPSPDAHKVVFPAALA